jgi:hypothetical protein
MKSKTATQICSTLILFGFFVPIFRWHGFEMNGMNYILSDHLPSYKYVLLSIPVSALLLVAGAVDGKYLFGRRTLSSIPLVSLLFVSVARFTSGVPVDDLYYDENPFLTIDFGFWLLLLFSLLLLLIRNEKRKVTQRFVQ